MKTRSARWPRSSSRRTTSLALVLFVMLCGLTLLLSGSPAARNEARVRHALERVERASGALDANNYGAARLHLQSAKEALERILKRTK